MRDTLKERISIDPPFKVEYLKDESTKVVNAKKSSEKETSVRKKLKERKAKGTKTMWPIKNAVKKEATI